MDGNLGETGVWGERLRGIIYHPSYRAYALRRLFKTIGIDLDQVLRAMGYRFEFLDRVVLYREWDGFLRAQGGSSLDALEISPGENSRWRGWGFKTYNSVQYPEFDICRDRLDRTFDVIVLDNVLEHVPEPTAAIRNVETMLRPNGHLLVATPFMIKVHGAPDDYSRWTQQGMRRLIEGNGFAGCRVTVGAWGNRDAVKASLDRWAMQGWRRRLRNEPDFPVMVWATATKVRTD